MHKLFNMKKTISLLFFIFQSFQFSIGQVDSLEYNIWEQIYDFKLEKNIYWFKSFVDNGIIETDSIIFQSDNFFSNFETNQRQAEYGDSVQLAIISRTLKSYYEPILYNKNSDFIRVCWFRDSIPIIIRLHENQDSSWIIYKTSDYFYEFKGNLKENVIIKPNKKEYRKLNDIVLNANLLYLKNGIDCPDKELAMRNTFFIEVKIKGNYNIIVLTDCNLKTRTYKKVFKVYKYLDKICQRHIA